MRAKKRISLNWKGILGLAGGLIALVLLYQWLVYRPVDATELYLRTGDALFKLGLLLLIVGVVIFTRLFSMRRRLGLINWMAMFKFRTPEEAQQWKVDEAEMNEKDEEVIKERGRDLTWLLAAFLVIAIAIWLTNLGLTQA